MVIITTQTDLQYRIDGVSGVTGQSPFKKNATIDHTDDWKLVDKLGHIKTFEFNVPNDEFHRANVMLERDITVPFITPFKGLITTRERSDKSIKFVAEDNAFHLSRRVFMHDGVDQVIYTDQNWYNKDWKIRIPMEIKTTKLLSELTDYTILVHITDIHMARESRLDGFDFLFTDKDGTTKLSHEIERYVVATGDLYVWINLPKLESESSRDIYFYYNNPDAADQQDIEGTWNSNYSMVQHLNGDSIDSTVNNNDGTDTSISYVTTSGIGEAAQFDAVNSKIDCASGATIDDIFVGGGTVEFIINSKSDGEANLGHILTKKNGANTGWEIFNSTETGGFIKIVFSQDFSGTVGTWETSLAVQLNKDAYCAITYDNSSVSNTPILYINGQKLVVGDGLTETSTPVGTADTDAGQNLIIGNETGQTQTFDGEIDEVRMSIVIKLTTEIKLNYRLKSEQPDTVIIKSKENYVKPVDEIAQDIIDNANDDMPLLSSIKILDLVSLWQFNNNSTDSYGTNDGTWVGTEQYVKGVYHDDSGAFFDGASYVTIPDFETANYAENELTVVGFIKTTGTSTSIINQWSNQTASEDFSWQMGVHSTGELTVFVSAAASVVGKNYISVSKINDGRNYQVGFTFKAGVLKLFINGVEVAVTKPTDTAITTIRNGTQPVVIGALKNAAGSYANFASNNTCYDDFRDYSRALTATEMLKLSQTTESHTIETHQHVKWKLGDGVVEEISGLLSLWKFDDSLVDTKGENNLSIVGTEQYVDGYFNNMFDFDGSTYLIATDPTYDFENNDDFTVTFYVKTSSVTKSALITKQNTPTSTGWGIYMEANGKISFNMINTNTSDHLEVKGDIAINDDTMKLVTVRKNTGLTISSVSIRVDNVENTISTIFDNLSATVLNDIKLYFGSTADAGNKFTGGMEDVRIYDNYVPNTKLKRLSDATTSGVDFIRNDEILQNILPIEFDSDNGLEALIKIAKSIGTDLYFDSTNYIVFLRQKGKTIKDRLDIFLDSKPRQTLSKVTNILNVIGDDDANGIQLRDQFTVQESTKYNYEKTVINSQIKTSTQMKTIGNNLLDQFKEPIDDIPATVPYDQFTRFDLQSGDIVKISDPQKETNSSFRITSINATPNQVKLVMRDTKNSVIFTGQSENLPSVLANLISRIDQIDKNT